MIEISSDHGIGLRRTIREIGGDEQSSIALPASDQPKSNAIIGCKSTCSCGGVLKGSAATGSKPELGDCQMVQVVEEQQGRYVL
jgi:hypothetical protein